MLTFPSPLREYTEGATFVAIAISHRKSHCYTVQVRTGIFFFLKKKKKRNNDQKRRDFGASRAKIKLAFGASWISIVRMYSYVPLYSRCQQSPKAFLMH